MKHLVSLLLITSILLVGGSASFAQDGGDDDYVYTVVGGEDESVTYDDQEVDGFTITDYTYRSLYPLGFEFKATITPPEGVSIQQVTMFYTFVTGKLGRVPAQATGNDNEWLAVPYSDRGLPPWHEIDAVWHIELDDGTIVESEPVYAMYYDESREWFHTENDDVLVYWYGMPVELGKLVLDAIEANREKYLTGFGAPLPYRPMAVIFPPGPAWLEYRGGVEFDDTQLGFTGTIVGEAGSTIQRVRTLEPAQIRADCVWNPAESSVEFQMNVAASTVSHEIAHLYQQELGVSGPTWWIEGQATFFEVFEEYPIHDRLRNLAELRGGDFPSFQGDGPSGGALSASEDGCTHLIYDMGASFMTWIVDSFDGIDTYRAIVDELRKSQPLSSALEAATGVVYLDLENQWRAFLGVGPVPAEILDPGAVLSETVDAQYEVGDSITLQAATLQTPLYNKPSPTSIANASCFNNSTITILRSGYDGEQNWYEVDCQGLVGWVSEATLQ